MPSNKSRLNGDGLDTLPEEMTIDGQQESWNGNQGQVKEKEVTEKKMERCQQGLCIGATWTRTARNRNKRRRP